MIIIIDLKNGNAYLQIRKKTLDKWVLMNIFGMDNF